MCGTSSKESVLICRPRCAFAQETSSVTAQSKRETSNIESGTHVFVHRWLTGSAKKRRVMVISRPPSVTPCVHHEPIPLTTAHTQPLLSFHHFNTTSVPLGFPLISPLPFLSLPPNHFLFLSMFIQKGSAVTQSGASFGHLLHVPCRHPRATLGFQMVVLWHALDSFLHLVLHDSTQSECRGM